MRLEALAVILRTASAMSASGMNSAMPWNMLRSE
jgi:hypothetical protein